MAKIIILVLVVLLGGFAISHFSSQPPLRGMVRQPGSSQAVLLARARPAATFALDQNMNLLTAGWCSIRPETHESLQGEARLWLALYGHAKGLLVTAVADGENNWEWMSGDHTAFPAIRRMSQNQGNRTLFETLSVLDRKHDPFCGSGQRAGQGSDQETGVCLVYRARLLLEFEQCQVIVEYHEDLPQNLVQDIAFANDYLNAFQQRARQAGHIVRLEKEESQHLAQGIEKMGTLDKAVSRTSLARWTGMMHRKGRL